MSLSDDIDASLFTAAPLELLREQPALTNLRAFRVPGHDPVMGLFETDLWTVSLSRRRMVQIEFDITRSLVRNRTGHRALALTVTKSLREVQSRRHSVATAHGMQPTQFSALDADLLLIDRLNALLPSERRLGLREMVKRHRTVSIDDGDEDMSSCWLAALAAGHSTITISLRSGDPAPIMETETPIGDGSTASLNGNVVSVASPLPETLLTASIGRRLGELVATGIPALDERRIIDAGVDCGVTSITLQPDLITIGEALRLRAAH